MISLHKSRLWPVGLLKSCLFLFTLCLSSLAYAQEDVNDNHNLSFAIPEVALLDLESETGTSIVLNAEAPTEGGNALSFENAKDSSVWLNYSSVISSTTEATRTIFGRISSGSLPDGLRIMVRAQADAGNGDGTVGTSTGGVRLGPNEKPIISNIGTCFTGSGAGNGHNLAYRLELRPAQTYADIDFDQATTLTITYTISNN
jgi:hypothetical protein